MILSLLKVAVLIITIMIFAPHGVLWTCIGVGATFVLDTFLCVVFERILDGIKMLPLLGGLLPVAITSAVMGGGVYATRAGLAAIGLHASWLTLLVEVVAGGIVYVAAAFVFARPLAMDLITQLRNIVKRRRGGRDG